VSTVVGVGVDLCEVERLRRTLARTPGFATRVYTDAERETCGRRRDPAEGLAARFAAKEAVLKALGTGLRMGVNWREIEVRRAHGQAPMVVLSGRCRALAEARGADRVLVSLTHDGDYALAQVVLVGAGG
jgi:holo-[acyl-carrier protein] synthase